MQYAWFIAIYALYMLVLVVFGARIGLHFFRATDYSLLLVFYLVWGNCLVAFAFLARPLSCCPLLHPCCFSSRPSLPCGQIDMRMWLRAGQHAVQQPQNCRRLRIPMGLWDRREAHSIH